MAIKKIKVSLVGMRFHSPPFNVADEIMRSAPVLKQEPQNEHDKNAIAVHIRGHKVGYIDKSSALIVKPILNSGTNIQISVGAISTNTIALNLQVQTNQHSITPPKITARNVCGIYKITIESDKYVYIGQANAINSRIREHWSELSVGMHSNRHLQVYWNELGESSFKTELVEQVPAEIEEGLARQRWLADTEKFWIKTYRERTTCLNILDGEIIPTKKALIDLAQEEKKHDQKVKEDKKNIAKELSLLDEKLKHLRKSERELNRKIKELNSFIFKNTGMIGFFIGKASKSEVEENKRNLEAMNSELQTSSSENHLVVEKISNLKRQRKGLKTTKQTNNFADARPHGIGRARITNKKIY